MALEISEISGLQIRKSLPPKIDTGILIERNPDAELERWCGGSQHLDVRGPM